MLLATTANSSRDDSQFFARQVPVLLATSFSPHRYEFSCSPRFSEFRCSLLHASVLVASRNELIASSSELIASGFPVQRFEVPCTALRVAMLLALRYKVHNCVSHKFSLNSGYSRATYSCCSQSGGMSTCCKDIARKRANRFTPSRHHASLLKLSFDSTHALPRNFS